MGAADGHEKGGATMTQATYKKATSRQMDVIEEEAMRRMVRHHGLDEALKCYDNDPTACATFDALMEEVANERGLTIKGWILTPVVAA